MFSSLHSVQSCRSIRISLQRGSKWRRRLLSMSPHERTLQSLDVEDLIQRELSLNLSQHSFNFKLVKQSVCPTLPVISQILPETQQTTQVSSSFSSKKKRSRVGFDLRSTLVRNTSDENEMRIIDESLAQLSVVFPVIYKSTRSFLSL